ncbi:hypothetical protein F5Y10DRAFT_250754 [Nemania abortiva]|nr:hypothetical protein F5Y10DRAFT_250754 [Nemania abortiva]
MTRFTETFGLGTPLNLGFGGEALSMLTHITSISLTREVFEMYRSGQIKTGPISRFDIADISQAFQFCSTKDRLRKVVLTLKKPDSQIQVTRSFEL